MSDNSDRPTICYLTYLLITLKAKNNTEKLKLLFPEHHLSHAASAFYPSPFEKAAILTLDGVGEWATASICLGDGKDITMLKELQFIVLDYMIGWPTKKHIAKYMPPKFNLCKNCCSGWLFLHTNEDVYKSDVDFCHEICEECHKKINYPIFSK